MPRGVPKAGFRKTKNRVAKMVENIAAIQKPSRFTINQRFGFISDMVCMLLENPSMSFKPLKNQV
jgi:hypothetical protein